MNSLVPGTQEGQTEIPGTLAVARLADGLEGEADTSGLPSPPGGPADTEGTMKGLF